MRIRIAATILALCGLAPIAITSLLCSEARAEQDWTTFTSKEGRFSIEMPGQPVKTETHQKSFVGTVTNHIFTAESGKDTFTVDYSDIPHVALHFAGPDTIYKHAKGALLKQTFSKEVSYTDVTVSGVKGKKLVYDTPPVQGHPKMRGDAILVLVGARLYVIDGVVRETEADANSQRFLSSVKVTK
jgi:hypothetical protein